MITRSKLRKEITKNPKSNREFTDALHKSASTGKRQSFKHKDETFFVSVGYHVDSLEDDIKDIKNNLTDEQKKRNLRVQKFNRIFNGDFVDVEIVQEEKEVKVEKPEMEKSDIFEQIYKLVKTFMANVNIRLTRNED